MADELPLGFRMKPAEIQSLAEPIFVRKQLEVDGQKILFVSRDFGFGREVREGYVYRLSSDSWQLIAFRRTSSPKLDLVVSGAEISVTAADGSVVLSIPIVSLSP